MKEELLDAMLVAINVGIPVSDYVLQPLKIILKVKLQMDTV